MECIFCGKKLNIRGKSHQKFCKNNPDRIVRKSNFIVYNNKVKNGEIAKINSNQHIKAKNNGEIYVVSEDTKRKLSNYSKNRSLSDSHKLKIKEGMQNAVKKYPDSYSSSNVCGRVKLIEYNGYKLHGNWELLIAKKLCDNNISWTNIIDGFEYYWNGDIHLYFPDFYLPKYNLYIEVKGYETERDRCKWNDFTEVLIVLKKDEISKLRKNEKTIFDYINNARVA